MYTPNKECPGFHISTFKRAIETNSKVVMIGDLNVILEPKLEKRNASKDCKKSPTAEQLITLMDEYLMQDVWRIRNHGLEIIKPAGWTTC